MSRGIWTKCWTTDGSQTFYYNAAKNQSVWQPPLDAIIHEAIHLKPYDFTDSLPVQDNNNSLTGSNSNINVVVSSSSSSSTSTTTTNHIALLSSKIHEEAV